MYARVANGTTEDYYPVRSVLGSWSDKSGTFIVQNTTLIIEKANFNISTVTSFDTRNISKIAQPLLKCFSKRFRIDLQL